MSTKAIDKMLTIMEYQIDLFVNNHWSFIEDR